ncbi:MAG: hypothetical protein PHC91_01575 [Eubacteriales bacterium]|nr:hypothetical protein [Eubacteriales bacterium]
MSKPSMIEKVKNLSLVVLFLTTVLLLYFFWGNLSFEDIKTPAAPVIGEETKPIKLLKPEQLVINFGADNYTVQPPAELWYNENEKDSFVEELGRFGPAENILVEDITYDKYQQVKGIESIWAKFNYNIPISDFCSTFAMDKPQSFDVIETVTEIGYSTADRGNSLFIYDGKNEKRYRLLAEDPKNLDNKGNTEFPALIDSIEAEGYNIYYPISSIMRIANETLVPLSVEANLRSFPYLQDTYSYQTEKVKTMAEKFFGKNLDFVREIKEENGTVIYMYGYGQNVLIVNTDGGLEYKETQLGGNTEQSFSGALETALRFIASHGSWESIEGAKLTPYLKSVVPKPGNEKGYRFTFGVEINGNRLYYEEGNPITIEVISGKVTYFKRQLIDFDQEDIEAIETDGAEEAFSAVNLLAQNLKYLYKHLLHSEEVTATEDSDVMLEAVASRVKNIKIGYVKPAAAEAAEIQPAWVITVNNTEFYFDLYAADPIGYSKE